jgi:hypothetical protein
MDGELTQRFGETSFVVDVGAMRGSIRDDKRDLLLRTYKSRAQKTR